MDYDAEVYVTKELFDKICEPDSIPVFLRRIFGMIFTREVIMTLGNNSAKIPFFIRKVYGNLIMEAIGKSQFRFCSFIISKDSKYCCITYFTKEYSTDQDWIKLDDILKAFEGKKIEVSTSIIDKDCK